MYCQGEMKRSTAPFHNRKNYHLMLDAIPALVCAQCGEVYFDEAEVETIQKIIRTVDDQTEKITVSA